MKAAKLLELSEKFKKIAQDYMPVKLNLQSGDVQTILENSGLWNKSEEVAPLLSLAGIPDDASVNISFVITKGPSVSFLVGPSKSPATGKLAKMLKAKYGPTIQSILKSSKAEITAPITINWMKF